MSSEWIAKLGATFLAWDQPERARRIAEGLVVYDPDSAASWVLLARISDPIISMKYLKHALSLQPDHDEARFRMGVLLFQIGKHTEATRTLRSVSRPPWLDRASRVLAFRSS